MTRKYNDEEIAFDIAEGRLTAKDIAARHGLSRSHVSRIIRGESRADLQKRIKAIEASIRAQSRRLATNLSRVAWGRLGRLAGGDADVADETRRKAAVDILKLAMADAEADTAAADAPARREVDLTALSADTKAKVLAELGGPGE